MSYISDLLGNDYREDMTLDEVSAWLEEHSEGQADGDERVRTLTDEAAKLKSLVSRANSEAAGYKRQLREKMSQSEKDEAERKEREAALVAENGELKRTISLSQHTAQLMAMGYGKDLAESTAAAMVDNDMDTVISNQGKFIESKSKQIIKDYMKGVPVPGVGSAPSGAGIDYGAKCDEAMRSGNTAEAAYYMRMMQTMPASEE